MRTKIIPNDPKSRLAYFCNQNQLYSSMLLEMIHLSQQSNASPVNQVPQRHLKSSADMFTILKKFNDALANEVQVTSAHLAGAIKEVENVRQFMKEHGDYVGDEAVDCFLSLLSDKEEQERYLKEGIEKLNDENRQRDYEQQLWKKNQILLQMVKEKEEKGTQLKNKLQRIVIEGNKAERRHKEVRDNLIKMEIKLREIETNKAKVEARK